MAEIKEALVPDIGDYSDIPVIEVLVAVGDTVKKDQGLVTLESDKATMEVPSSVAGVVKELKVKVGDSLSEGKVVALIEVAEGEAAAPAAAAPAPAKSAAPAAATRARRPRPLLRRPLRPPAVAQWKRWCRTSATTPASRLSKCWSPSATRSRRTRAWSRWKATRPPWRCRRLWPVWSRRSRSRWATICRRATWLPSLKPKALPRRHRPGGGCRCSAAAETATGRAGRCAGTAGQAGGARDRLGRHPVQPAGAVQRRWRAAGQGTVRHPGGARVRPRAGRGPAADQRHREGRPHHQG